MNMNWILILGVSLLCVWSSVTPVLTQTDTTTCDLFYILQPVEHFTCNPFNGPYGMRIECVMYYTSRIDSTLSIYWYRILEGADDDQPELVNQFETQQSFFGDGELMRARFRIRNINEEHAGIYWCQIVRLSEEDNSIIELSFEPSQKIRLRPPSNYTNFPPCSNDFLSTQLSTCAINGVNLEPIKDNSFAQNVTTDSTVITNLSTDTSQGILTDGPATVKGGDELLPPWGYAVIAGGGLAVLITVVCMLCVLILICLWLRDRRKYASHSSQKGEELSTSPRYSISSDGATPSSQSYELHPAPFSVADQPSDNNDTQYDELSTVQEESEQSVSPNLNPTLLDERKTNLQANKGIQIALSESGSSVAHSPESPMHMTTTTSFTIGTEDDREHHDTNPDKNETNPPESIIVTPEKPEPPKSPKLDFLPKHVSDVDNTMITLSESNDTSPTSTGSINTFSTSPSTELPRVNDQGKSKECEATTTNEKDMQHQNEEELMTAQQSPPNGDSSTSHDTIGPSKESVQEASNS